MGRTRRARGLGSQVRAKMSRTTERAAEPNKLAVDKPREMRMETWPLDLVTRRSLMAFDQSRGNVTNTFLVE